MEQKTPITPSERIDQLLSYTGLNVSEFADEIGAGSKQSVHDVLNGKTSSISRNMKRLIASRYSEISEEWLVTGEGSMLKSEGGNSTQITQTANGNYNNQTQTVNSTLAGEVQGLIRQIQELQQQNAKLIDIISQLTTK